MKNYIRYGVHKKKSLLKDASKTYDGLVFPANILLYQYKATPGTVVFLEKPFFIDPMSYLFGENYEDFKKSVEGSNLKFKPSFEKLLTGHGFNPEVVLKLNYQEIRKELLQNSNRLDEFVQHCLDFQLNQITNSLKEAKGIAEDLLEKAKDFLVPEAIVPPYFFIDQKNYSESLELNSKILDIASSKIDPKNITPMLYLNKVLLKDATKLDEVITIFKKHAFKGYILWIENFSESNDATKESILAIAGLVKKLSEGGTDVTFLHAGYFGMIYKFFGATGICHGLGYGEVRSGISTAKGGGPPPVRYYIKDLHMFLTLDRSLELLRNRPELICDCPVCKNVVGDNPENITNYAGEDDLADLHYLYVRATEKKFINQSSFDDVISNLDITATLYDDLSTITRQVTDRKGKIYEEQFISSDYLRVWKDALSEAKGKLLEQDEADIFS